MINLLLGALGVWPAASLCMSSLTRYNPYLTPAHLITNITSFMFKIAAASDVTGRGAECPLRDFWPGNFCWPTGKKEARKKGKRGENWEEKKENCKREGGKWKLEKVTKWGEGPFFFFFFFFFCLSLFKTTKSCFGSTKMEIFCFEKAFLSGKKNQNGRWKRVTKWKRGEDLFFCFCFCFVLCCFVLFCCLSLFKVTKICFGFTKMEIFYREKHFTPGKKAGKMTLPPHKNFHVMPLAAATEILERLCKCSRNVFVEELSKCRGLVFCPSYNQLYFDHHEIGGNCETFLYPWAKVILLTRVHRYWRMGCKYFMHWQ